MDVNLDYLGQRQVWKWACWLLSFHSIMGSSVVSEKLSLLRLTMKASLVRAGGTSKAFESWLHLLVYCFLGWGWGVDHT